MSNKNIKKPFLTAKMTKSTKNSSYFSLPNSRFSTDSLYLTKNASPYSDEFMNTHILSVSVDFVDQPFAKPLQLSTGLITVLTEARVSIKVSVNGKEAEGQSNIYLSDLWAWPGGDLTHEEKDAAMRGACRTIADNLFALCGNKEAHPLELGLRLHESLDHLAPEVPLLARAVCASPFDAAIHDAVGNALKISAFDFYGSHFPIPSADSLFKQGSATAAIRALFQSPKAALPAWWIVSARDDLEATLKPAIEKSGYFSYKVKILAKDHREDALRVSEIYQAARQWGVATPRLSVDSNEGNPDTSSVRDFLHYLKECDSEAYGALEYLEQPTARDILAHPFDWHEVAALKPVLLDEGLTSFHLLGIAKQQGWSGFALKTCKGHSFTLVCAAWAKENDMLLSVQDLTNPGASALHSALLASHIDSINGAEINSPQFTPAANTAWLKNLGGIFHPQKGWHEVPAKNFTGLGSHLQEKED